MPVEEQVAKIMVVDDEEDVRELLTVMLTKRNFMVMAAASGKEALDKIALDLPDIIILDIHMPNMDGFQVHRRLREQDSTRAIPVIFCTALRIPDIVAGIKSPQDDYLQKPFSVVELQEKIARVLHNRSQPGN